MNTSRRFLLAGLAGPAAAPAAVAAAHWPDYVEAARAVLDARA
ncbi:MULTISPECIES: hypothetical protein [Bradyrhizobium]|nr:MULTISPECIES: hypothetical protein [Bradyrhizobium]MDN4986548.1 hypothetical protein [Bradyrhizobium sp. WYCCWR 13022]